MDARLEANKKMVKDFVQKVKNERHLERLGDYFAKDYVEHNPVVASFGPGLEGYRNFLGHLFSAFPDDVLELEVLAAEGDLVSYRAREQGTHRGEFLKIPATGRFAKWTELQWFRIKDGKVVEHWVDVDIYGWFQQLGVIPTPG